jgi:plasmid maintenance system antidote protein VapI
MTEMHDSPHPDDIVREERLKPLGLIVTAAAEALGVTRKALSKVSLLEQARVGAYRSLIIRTVRPALTAARIQ